MQIGYIMGMVVGGLLMLSIGGLLLNMNQSSGTLTVYETAKIEHETTMEYLKNEFDLIGYRFQQEDSPHIIHPNFDSTFVRFRYRPYDSDSNVEVRWAINQVDGEDRAVLTREEDGEAEVINHNLTTDSYFAFLNETGLEAESPNQIQRIELFIETMPRGQYGDSELKTRTETNIILSNLNL